MTEPLPQYLRSCRLCHNWRPPTPDNAEAMRRQTGRCGHDGELAHAGYSCARFVMRVAFPEDLGLTPAEVAWIRAHSTGYRERRLVQLFAAIKRSPVDPGLLAVFEENLATWREERERASVDPRLPVT